MVEHSAVNRGVVGSSPTRGAFLKFNYGPVAQLVRAPPCHGGGHGFESRLGRFVDFGLHAGVAELADAQDLKSCES